MSGKLERPYVFLPPAYRPLVFALSAGIVGLYVWDKTRSPVELVEPAGGWESKTPLVKIAAEAPPSINVSGALGGETPRTAAPPKKPAVAPGNPLEVADDANSFNARSEEERSAINEKLYRGLEAEKKRLGIAAVLERGAEGRPAAQATALRLKSREALTAAWAAAGLAGAPPVVDFKKNIAVYLAGPEGCGIAAVKIRKQTVEVVYGDSEFDASARVKAIPRSAKPIVLKRAE